MSVHSGSRNAKLASLSVGERFYEETAEDRWQSDMRMLNTPRSRRPKELDGMEFTASLFTAVPAKGVGGIRYLIAVERVK